jgi:tetratricopeptide (TPR) repeat protein
MNRSLTHWITLAACLLLLSSGMPQQSVVDSAKELFNAGKFKDAEVLLRAEISKSPGDAALYYWLGKCAFELYDDDLAYSSADKAVDLDLKNPDYHYFLGTASGYKAEHSNWFSGLSLARKAQHEFYEAVQLNPNNVEAQRDLISYYIAAPGIAGGGDDKAEAQITVLDVSHPVPARLARMELFENRKKWTEAANEARGVISVRPRLVKSYLDVAEYFMNREDVTSMRAALAAIPRGLPPDPHTDYYVAVANILAGENLPDAQKAINAYLAKQPPPRREDHVTLGDAHSWLGRAYEKLGQRNEGIAECRAALKLEPKNKSAHECLRRVDSQ